jgi:hypothetical protein
MPREKKTVNCQQCGKEFTRNGKDQKYCGAPCRFEHFFANRDSLEVSLEAVTKENEALKARDSELQARNIELEARLNN